MRATACAQPPPSRRPPPPVLQLSPRTCISSLHQLLCLQLLRLCLLALPHRFLTASENPKRELFYAFFESEGNPAQDPLVLWLGRWAAACLCPRVGPWLLWLSCMGRMVSYSARSESRQKLARLLPACQSRQKLARLLRHAACMLLLTPPLPARARSPRSQRARLLRLWRRRVPRPWPVCLRTLRPAAPSKRD